MFLGIGKVQDAYFLRRILAKRFTVFKENIQQDASDAYLSIIECFSDTKNLCSFISGRRSYCVECGKVILGKILMNAV